jgi:hypothetical protein
MTDHSSPAQPAGIGATALGAPSCVLGKAAAATGYSTIPMSKRSSTAPTLTNPCGRPRVSGPDSLELVSEQVAVRSRFLDQALLEVAHQGTTQVVLLACGMDSRAFRLDWPAETTVYEADQPDVLAFKSSVLQERRARPRCHRVDLRAHWPATLIAVGSPRRRPHGLSKASCMAFRRTPPTSSVTATPHALPWAAPSRWSTARIPPCCAPREPRSPRNSSRSGKADRPETCTPG